MCLTVLAYHQLQHLVLLQQECGRDGGTAAGPVFRHAAATITALGAAERQAVVRRLRHDQRLDAIGDIAVPVVGVHKIAVVRGAVLRLGAKATLLAAAGKLHQVGQSRNVGDSLNDDVAVITGAATGFSAGVETGEVLE